MYGVLWYVTRGHSFIFFSICNQSVTHRVLYDEMGAEIVQERSLMLSGRCHTRAHDLEAREEAYVRVVMQDRAQRGGGQRPP